MSDAKTVFVAGATGALGKRAVRELVRAGLMVTGVARSSAKASVLRELGATPVEIDAFDPQAVGEAVRGHDVVMNLATHIPAPTKAALPGAWKENDRIRTELSAILVDAAIAAGAGRYVQESIAFAYADGGDRWIDEDAPLDTPKKIRAFRDAEAAAQRFSASGGTGVVLRFGQFYGADTPHTRLQVDLARRGLMQPGDNDGYLPTIHLDDAATAVVAALGVPAGVYNVTDDQPLTRTEAAALFAGLVGRKKVRPVPKALVAPGGATLRFLARSQRVSNERFKKASGWEPAHPSAREGLPDVVREVLAAGDSGRDGRRPLRDV